MFLIWKNSNKIHQINKILLLTFSKEFVTKIKVYVEWKVLNFKIYSYDYEHTTQLWLGKGFT